MRRALIATAAFSMGLIAISCSKNNATQPGRQEQPQGQEAPAWKLSVKADCAGQEVESCIAAYGFSVSADGKYQVGPAPQGQVKTGNITPEQLLKLEGLLAQSMNQAQFSANSAEKCEPYEVTAENDSLDSLVLTRKGVEKPIYRITQEQRCYQTATLEEGKSLHDALSELAGLYYSRPFPDACADAAAVLESMYPSVSACAVDADCAYVTEDLDPILPASDQYVTAETCTMIKPLTVANLNSFVAQEAKLLEALKSANTACAGRVRDNCDFGTKGFQSSAKPVCAQGACRINPAAVIQ